MKIRFLLFSFLAVLAYVTLSSLSGGPATVQSLDVSGAPGSSNCTQCHSGGAFSTATSISVRDGSGNLVTSVNGDSVYQVSVVVSAAAGNPTGFGFQATLLEDSSDTYVGSFVNPGSFVQFATLASGKQVAEHTATSTTTTFIFDWRAPSTVPGSTVTVYAYGNAVDGNGVTSGDQAAGDNLSLTFIDAQVPSAIASTELSNINVNVFPNPVVDQLNVAIDAQKTGSYSMQVFNINGQLIQQRVYDLNKGPNNLSLDVQDFAAGNYQLLLRDTEGRQLTKRFVKF